MSRIRAPSLILALLFLPLQVHAMSCTVSSLPIGDMGIYFPSADITRQYAIYLSCTSGGASASLMAGPSQNTGSIENRQLKHESKTDTLRYQLCLDSHCGIVFGNSGPNIGHVLINDRHQGRFSFWVKVYGGQYQVSAGYYRDAITLTVTP
jgi:spore coat protein U-like protein